MLTIVIWYSVNNLAILFITILNKYRYMYNIVNRLILKGIKYDNL